MITRCIFTIFKENARNCPRVFDGAKYPNFISYKNNCQHQYLLKNALGNVGQRYVYPRLSEIIYLIFAIVLNPSWRQNQWPAAALKAPQKMWQGFAISLGDQGDQGTTCEKIAAEREIKSLKSAFTYFKEKILKTQYQISKSRRLKKE